MVSKLSKKPKVQRKTETQKKIKPTVQKLKKSKSTSSLSSLVRTEELSMGRAGAARVLSHSKKRVSLNRGVAYYAMGGIALGIGVLVVGYQEAREIWHFDIDRQVEVSSAPRIVNSKIGVSAPQNKVETIPEKEAESGPLSDEFHTVSTLKFSEKINFWSSFIENNSGGREKIGSLVSGKKINDFAPIVPRDYNCTTYVETVVALARSKNSDNFFDNLMAIRYLESRPSFSNRNHFPEVDWIVNNQKAEILLDITRRVAQKSGLIARVERKNIQKGKWLQAQINHQDEGRSLASVGTLDPSKIVHAQVPYIEISQFEKAFSHIPQGSVLNLVHKNDNTHPVIITHQGFMIREGNRILLRHASSGGKIRTNDLARYLRGLVKIQRSHSKWPLIGVNVIQINASTSESNRRNTSM